MVLPVGAEDNGTSRGVDWLAIHAKLMKLIQLLKLSGMPLWPSVQVLELAAGEIAKSAFSISNSFGLNGGDE